MAPGRRAIVLTVLVAVFGTSGPPARAQPMDCHAVSAVETISAVRGTTWDGRYLGERPEGTHHWQVLKVHAGTLPGEFAFREGPCSGLRFRTGERYLVSTGDVHAPTTTNTVAYRHTDHGLRLLRPTMVLPLFQARGRRTVLALLAPTIAFPLERLFVTTARMVVAWDMLAASVLVLILVARPGQPAAVRPGDRAEIGTTLRLPRVGSRSRALTRSPVAVMTPVAVMPLAAHSQPLAAPGDCPTRLAPRSFRDVTGTAWDGTYAGEDPPGTHHWLVTEAHAGNPPVRLSFTEGRCSQLRFRVGARYLVSSGRISQPTSQNTVAFRYRGRGSSLRLVPAGGARAGYPVQLRELGHRTDALALLAPVAVSPLGRAIRFADRLADAVTELSVSLLILATTLDALERPPAAALDSDADARRHSLLVHLDAHVRAHADRFGIFWVTDDGGVVVQVTSRAGAEDRAIVRGILDGLDVRFETVPDSIAELEAAHEGLNDLLRRHDPRVDAVRAVSLDIGDNVLTVRVAPGRVGEVRSLLVERWGGHLFRLLVGGPDVGAGTAAVPADEGRHAAALDARLGVAVVEALTDLARALTSALQTRPAPSPHPTRLVEANLV